MVRRRDQQMAFAVGKKYSIIFLAMILMLIFVSGCESGAEKPDADDPTVTSEGAASAERTTEAALIDTGGASQNTLGIDLTAFDKSTASTVAHEIFENQNEYLGTKIKLRGHYESADNKNTGGRIHSVVVSNDAGCCQPVFEFIWNGEHAYPKDYPEDFSEIEVEGVLETYEEDGTTYYYLAADDVSKVSS